MKFANVGQGDGPGWKWFTYPGTDFEVELRCVPGSQLARAQARFQLGSERPKLDGYYGHIAKHWFKDVRGAESANGEALDGTSEKIRAAILADNLDVAVWVTETLQNSSGWLEEGKDVGTSG